MTWRNFDFSPGVVKDDTELMASQSRGRRRWTDSDRIRFVNGRPQKLGGWAKHVTGTFVGLARGMFGWTANSGVTRLAVGTEKKLYALEAATYLNITPIRRTATLTNPFQTTNTSTTVTVTDSAHGAAVGDYVQISGASAVGGITVDGNYAVVTAASGSYTITHTSSATSTASGGGTVTAKYEISIGLTDGTQGTGWGVGPYGNEAYGTARTGTYILLPPRTWTIQPWGQYIVACPRGGSIYEWQLNATTRAAVIANAPTQNIGILVTEEKHLVALGAGGERLVAQWCDRDDNTAWTASDQVTAGSRKLTGGSTILAGLKTSSTNIIFTDGAVWTMTHVGGDDIFAFNQIAVGAVALIGPMAAGEAGGVVYWMGKNDFWMYDGVVRQIPNTNDIKRFVFDNLTALQRDKCFCSVNTLFTELWFFYTTATEINRYVKYNWIERAWDVGTLARTSMLDRVEFDSPLAAGTDSIIYKHESGNDDVQTATTPSMAEFIVSAPFELSDGDRNMDVFGCQPDFKGLIGSVNMAFLTRNEPQAALTTETTFAIGTGTKQIDFRAAGQQAQVRVAGTETGNYWRLGVLKMDVQPGGER